MKIFTSYGGKLQNQQLSQQDSKTNVPPPNQNKNPRNKPMPGDGRIIYSEQIVNMGSYVVVVQFGRFLQDCRATCQWSGSWAFKDLYVILNYKIIFPVYVALSSFQIFYFFEPPNNHRRWVILLQVMNLKLRKMKGLTQACTANRSLDLLTPSLKIFLLPHTDK